MTSVYRASLVIWFSYVPQCLIEMPGAMSKAFRPPESCEFCRGVTEIKRISNITPEQFEEEYAYSGIPVIVTDATQNWTALDVSIYWCHC